MLRLQRQNEYKRTHLESCARLYTSRRRASLTHPTKSNNPRIRVCLFICRLAGSKRILAYTLRATPSQRRTPKRCPWALLHSAHLRTCVRAARSSYPDLSHMSSLLLVSPALEPVPKLRSERTGPWAPPCTWGPLGQGAAAPPFMN